LLDGGAIALQFDRHEALFPASALEDDEVEFYSTKLGPAAAARPRTESEGWEALRAELAALHDPSGEVAEYLQILGTKLA